MSDNSVKPNLWISVDDRFPETNCLVLARKTNGKRLEMSYHAPFDSCKRQFHWWGFGKWVNQHSQVTHWMPLPELPNDLKLVIE